MRYRILDSLLSDRNRYYTITDLIKKVNEALVQTGMEPVSRRCIEKDLNALECAPYDAPIERVWRSGCKHIRYERAGFSIFTKKLLEAGQNDAPVGKPQKEVLLWVTEDGFAYISTQPLHASQQVVEDEACEALRRRYAVLRGGHFVKFRCRLNDDLERMLMSRMDQLVVLEPRELSDNMMHRIQRMNAIRKDIFPEGCEKSNTFSL